MALRRTTSRRRASITSLIDVIFLLLLFFMLASTFSKFSEVEIAAAAPSPTTGETPNILEMEIGTNSLTLNGSRLPYHRWKARIREKQTDKSVLALRVQADVSAQRLTDILVELNTIPDLKIYVLDMP